MRRLMLLCLVLIGQFFPGVALPAGQSPPRKETEMADSLFKAGKFAEAEKMYSRAVISRSSETILSQQ
jgi:hypothetical protein